MTTKYCPHCEKTKETKAVPFEQTDFAKASQRNWHNTDLKDIMPPDFKFQFFVRRVKCLSCNNTWVTYEIARSSVEDMKKKLIKLTEIIEIKEKEKESLSLLHVSQEETLHEQLAKKDEIIKNLSNKLASIHTLSTILKEL